MLYSSTPGIAKCTSQNWQNPLEVVQPQEIGKASLRAKVKNAFVWNRKPSWKPQKKEHVMRMNVQILLDNSFLFQAICVNWKGSNYTEEDQKFTSNNINTLFAIVNVFTIYY